MCSLAKDLSDKHYEEFCKRLRKAERLQESNESMFYREDVPQAASASGTFSRGLFILRVLLFCFFEWTENSDTRADGADEGIAAGGTFATYASVQGAGTSLSLLLHAFFLLSFLSLMSNWQVKALRGLRPLLACELLDVSCKRMTMMMTMASKTCSTCNPEPRERAHFFYVFVRYRGMFFPSHGRLRVAKAVEDIRRHNTFHDLARYVGVLAKLLEEQQHAERRVRQLERCFADKDQRKIE